MYKNTEIISDGKMANQDVKAQHHQNINDDRDLARERQGKKVFISHKILDCLNNVKMHINSESYSGWLSAAFTTD